MATISVPEHEELAYEDSTPTPSGWRRKLIPYIGKGLVPARIDVTFVAPTGEEFRSKAQLQRYLKKTKGSPSIAEFIWSIDETPRRSSRSASKRSISPPKTMSKKKPAAKVPLEEAKANKRSSSEKESAVKEASNEDIKRPQKRAKNVTHKEGKEDNNGEASPTESDKGINGGLTTSSSPRKAQEKKKKHMKDTKKKKSIKTDAKSNDNMNEDTPHMQNEQHENGKEEKLETDTKEETVEEDGKEEALEQPVSEEGKDEETQKAQAKAKAKDLNGCIKNKDVGLENDNGTTTSLLGSDLSAEGMEADSDLFRSEEGRAVHGQEVNNVEQGEHASASEGS
ncbi:hypothetical protein L7F22_058520 [Adiantum nelumboides]|nr:hypothetical protein [Adiantum nelumboides]